MKLLFYALVLGAAFVAADPWRPRPGRGAYKRDANPEAVAAALPMAVPEAEADPYHLRQGPKIYTWVKKREPGPTAMPEPIEWFVVE